MRLDKFYKPIFLTFLNFFYCKSLTNGKYFYAFSKVR